MVLAGAVQTVGDVAAAVVLVFMVAGVVAVWSSVRAARRRLQRWRRLAARARVVGVVPTVVTAAARMPVADLGWWSVQRDRHRMWRSVAAAERSVATAKSARAPIGDLAGLTRQLRTTATAVDTSLRAGGPSAGARSRRDVDAVIASAQQVQATAADALLSVASPDTAGLAAAVRDEVSAVRHGLAAAALISRR